MMIVYGDYAGTYYGRNSFQPFSCCEFRDANAGRRIRSGEECAASL
jgi:hypothetical protein